MNANKSEYILSRYRIAPGKEGLSRIDWSRVAIIDTESFEYFLTKNLSIVFSNCYDVSEGKPFSLRNYLIASSNFDLTQQSVEARMREYNRYRTEIYARMMKHERDNIFFDRQEQAKLKKLFEVMRVFCEVAVFYDDEQVSMEELSDDNASRVLAAMSKMGVEVSINAQEYFDYKTKKRVKRVMTKKEFMRRATIMGKGEAKKTIIMSGIVVGVGAIICMSGLAYMARAFGVLSGVSEEVILVKND